MTRKKRTVLIPVGNREPRQRTKPPAPASTTSGFLARTMEQLEVVGPTNDEDMRRRIVPIDRTRYRMLRDNMMALGAIVLRKQGSRLVWELGPRHLLFDPRLMLSADPEPAKSNTHPGMSQLYCSVCGLIVRVFPSHADAIEWFYRVHIIESVGHQ